MHNFAPIVALVKGTIDIIMGASPVLIDGQTEQKGRTR